MNQTPKLSFALHSGSFFSVLLIIGFSILSRIGSEGIYTYSAIGALYELLWLPLLAILFGIPIVWFILALKKRVGWSKIILPLILSGITLVYLIISQ